MTDRLKAALAVAREAGLTGLVCGTCDNGDGECDALVDGELTAVSCPACDGTGEPSAAEVLLWVAMRQTSKGGHLFVRPHSVATSGEIRYWHGTEEGLAAAVAEAAVAAAEVGL